MKISLNRNTIEEDEIQAAIEVLRSGDMTFGRRCVEFEDTFADYMGVKNAIFVNSGSSANLLAMFSLSAPILQSDNKLKSLKDKEVIVPALTWSTTIWPVVQAGAIPVFVDCDPRTLQIDVDAVSDAINENTAGIFVAHILGSSADIETLRDLALSNDVWLAEDTCESLGVKNKGKFVGTFGDVGTFSFYFSHHITTIEGGMVVTNNNALAETMRSMRAHGWTRHMKQPDIFEDLHKEIDPRFLFISTGFNLRPTEINAAIGKIQLQKLLKFNTARSKTHRIWEKAFADCDKIFTTMVDIPGIESAIFGFPVICKDAKTKNALKSHLENKGIETRPIICGNMVRQPALRNTKYRVQGNLLGADKVMDCGLYWGSHPMMSDIEVNYVIEAVRAFAK